MVQKSLSLKVIFWLIFLRIVIFCGSIFIAAYESPLALNILEGYLGYITPPGFFGFTLADAFISLALGLVFFGGIFFGVLGRKIDYAIEIIFIIYALWEYSGTSTTTTAMLIGLI